MKNWIIKNYNRKNNFDFGFAFSYDKTGFDILFLVWTISYDFKVKNNSFKSGGLVNTKK